MDKASPHLPREIRRRSAPAAPANTLTVSQHSTANISASIDARRALKERLASRQASRSKEPSQKLKSLDILNEPHAATLISSQNASARTTRKKPQHSSRDPIAATTLKYKGVTGSTVGQGTGPPSENQTFTTDISSAAKGLEMNTQCSDDEHDVNPAREAEAFEAELNEEEDPTLMDPAIELCCFEAKLAGACGRYQEMKELMLATKVSEGQPPNSDQCELMFTAFKQCLMPQRGRLKEALRIKDKLRVPMGGDAELLLGQEINDTRETIRTECLNMAKHIEESLIPVDTSQKNRAFLFRFLADTYRYLAECSVGIVRRQAKKGSAAAYKTALMIGRQVLPAWHKNRLATAIGYSIFQRDLLSDEQAALYCSTQAFSEAVAEIHNIPEKAYKDVIVLLDVLKDNIDHWSRAIQSQESKNHSRLTAYFEF